MSEVFINLSQEVEADSSTTFHRLLLGSSIVLLSASGVNLVHRPPLNLIMLGAGLLGMCVFQAVDLRKVKRLLNLSELPAQSASRSSLVCYLTILGLSLGLLAAAGLACQYRPPLNLTLFSSGLIGLIASMTLRLKTLQ